MRNLLIVGCVVAMFSHGSLLRAQEPIQPDSSSPGVGFAKTVSEMANRMEGKWAIKSATLHGAGLPLEVFEFLTVDGKGFELRVQEQTRRFEFKEFRLESKTFLAMCSDKDLEAALIYEVGMTNGMIRIRYRTKGAHVAPQPTTNDGQFLVQTWTKEK